MAERSGAGDHPAAKGRDGSGRKGGGRKRTLVVSLLALGAGAVTIGAFMESDEKTDNRIYKTVEQCKKEQFVSADECSRQFDAARVAHEKNAPLFPEKASCEQEYGEGNCKRPETSHASNRYYIPAMAGYLMGRRANGGYQSAPLFRKRGDASGQYRQMARFPYPQAGAAGQRARTTSFRGQRWRTSGNSSRVYSTARSTSRSGVRRSGFGRSGFRSSSRSWGG